MSDEKPMGQVIQIDEARTPLRRHSSSALVPASCSFKIPMICSSVKRLLRILDLLAIDSTIRWRKCRGAGHTLSQFTQEALRLPHDFGRRSLELDHVNPGQNHPATHEWCTDKIIDGVLLDIRSFPGHSIDRDYRLVFVEECRCAGIEDGAIGR